MENSSYKAEEMTKAQVEHFLYDFDPRIDGLPKRLDPVLVEKLLREILQQDRIAHSVAGQFAELADFYQLTGLVPDLLKWLDRKDFSETDFLSAVAFTRAVGFLGTEAQRHAGWRYYQYLLNQSYAERYMDVLVKCYAVYASDEPAVSTVQRIDQLVTSLKARELSEPDVDILWLNLEDLRNVDLARIDASVQMEGEIMSQSVERRLDDLVDIYLGLELKYYEYVSRWSVRMIQREARALGQEPIISAFRRALLRMETGNVSAEEASARRAKIFHALEFFGDQLGPAEVKAMRPQTKYLDLLSTEP